MLPKGNKYLMAFLQRWCFIKNKIYNGEAGLQFSINSTSEQERIKMFSGNSLMLNEISYLASNLPKPKGRKYTLNFALCNYEIDAVKLSALFNPVYFICKITPMHLTNSCVENGLQTKDGYDYYYPYKEVEESLKKQGFDVIVFIPSKDEDESRITCGNAILSNK
jgi:23S rRNA (adenine2503-C2)-methyltransferase